MSKIKIEKEKILELLSREELDNLDLKLVLNNKNEFIITVKQKLLENEGKELADKLSLEFKISKKKEEKIVDEYKENLSTIFEDIKELSKMNINLIDNKLDSINKKIKANINRKS